MALQLNPQFGHFHRRTDNGLGGAGQSPSDHMGANTRLIPKTFDCVSIGSENNCVYQRQTGQRTADAFVKAKNLEKRKIEKKLRLSTSDPQKDC